jgi:hypothetical protein
MKPRFSMPPSGWLALAITGFVAAGASWQSQRLDRLRPPANDAGAARSASDVADGHAAQSAQAGAGQPHTAPTATEPVPASLPDRGADEAPRAVQRPLDPSAGRVVLRCVIRGQVTYKDVNAGCPEGASERVTVFPTQGVGKPR